MEHKKIVINISTTWKLEILTIHSMSSAKQGGYGKKEDYLDAAFAVFWTSVEWIEALVKKLDSHKMVEPYSKNANHNMRRPVVKDEIVDFMRTRQKPVAGALGGVRSICPQKENIPIIRMKR